MHSIVDGLEKKGNSLTKEEQYLLRGLIKCDSVSVHFIHYMVERFGAESIKSAFLIDNDTDEIGLDYLLHRYKGHFYRPRYPSTSLSDYCRQYEN